MHEYLCSTYKFMHTHIAHVTRLHRSSPHTWPTIVPFKCHTHIHESWLISSLHTVKFFIYTAHNNAQRAHNHQLRKTFISFYCHFCLHFHGLHCVYVYCCYRATIVIAIYAWLLYFNAYRYQRATPYTHVQLPDQMLINANQMWALLSQPLRVKVSNFISELLTKF